MIAKKNSRFDLERKRTALFQVGLLVAGSFTLAAFTYKAEVPREQELAGVSLETVFYQLEPKEKPIEEPVKQQQQQQQQMQQQSSTSSSTQISQSITIAQNTKKEPDAGVQLPNIGIIGDSVIDIEEDYIEEFPPIPAEYIGGYPAMQEYIMTTLNYPEEDIWAGNQGKVFVSFVVEKDGSVSNVEIERGVTKTIDREAKRIVREFPKWKPGEGLYGKVRTRVRLPINFVVK